MIPQPIEGQDVRVGQLGDDAALMARLEAKRREMRLQQLREEFEAARVVCRDAWSQLLHASDWAVLWLGQFGNQSEYRFTIIAARRYIIARDFNEFDPQRADMLWKLQHQ